MTPKSTLKKLAILQSIRRTSTSLAAFCLTTVLAFAGTVSPQLNTMAPNQPVQVIVQYTPSLLGGLLSTVCGVVNLLNLLPGGELCSMTVADAVNLAQNPQVAHVSVNNTLQATDSAVYDYTPQTLQPTASTAVSDSRHGPPMSTV